MSENIAKLTAERDQTFLLGFSHNLTNLNHKLSSENENLRKDHDNLMDQLDMLTQAYTASQGQITNLRTENQQLERQNQELKTENQALGRQNQQLERQNQEMKTEYQALGRQNQQLERQNQQLERQNQEMKTQNEEPERQNQELKTENQQLKTQHQQLETERNTFTKTIEDLETKRNELDRTQWIIDAYCPKKDGEEIKEEDDYVNVAGCTLDKTAATSGRRFLSFAQSFAPMTVCWLILFVIMALRIYFTSVMSNLTNLNHKLSSENETLRRDHDNLMGHLDKLTQAYTASQSQITNLRTENQRLERQKQQQKQQLGRQNQQLKTQNQQLETKRNTFTKTIEDLETMWNVFVVHRTQGIIDAYCPKKDGERQCEPCQRGWTFFQSSCYVLNSAEWRSWDEAQTNYKRLYSDLVVVVNEQEKTFISDKSLDSSDNRGYWIGLRVEDGKWKWVDGSDLTESSWIQPPADGHCAISVRNTGWRSVSCATTNHWICKQKALD
ncbi:uncharacterized protein LOC143324738 [Chaetodon auriga]|uniref:uncharacterized protein LOC143324738 n=1 Tax=Chaetodon auriga TaxID=39042 RepID=UPI004032BA34